MTPSVRRCSWRGRVRTRKYAPAPPPVADAETQNLLWVWGEEGETAPSGDHVSLMPLGTSFMSLESTAAGGIHPSGRTPP
jgi:hypothetical protein